MLPGGSHQRRPKHDAEAAPAEEQVDEPASKYARMQWFVVLWLVCDNVLLTFGSLGKKSSRAAFFHAEMLVFPISISLNTLYVFGTLDSSAVGKRALIIWVVFWVYQAVFTPAAMWARGESFLRGLMPLVAFSFMATAFGWLIRILRQELRALGSLDETMRRITTRLLEIMGLQAALVVIGLTRGIGRNAFNRISATIFFSISLIMAWLYSLAIFDVAGVDAVAATQLQLRPIEGCALAFTGLLVLAGLASYILSEQSRPKRRKVMVIGDTFMVSMLGAYFCTARIVWVARRRRRSKVREDPDAPA
jgi:hypothetical protein